MTEFLFKKKFPAFILFKIRTGAFREFMNILDQLGLVLRRGRAADAPAKGDLDTGGLALEGAQDQLVPLPQVKAHPVDITHSGV